MMKTNVQWRKRSTPSHPADGYLVSNKSTREVIGSRVIDGFHGGRRGVMNLDSKRRATCVQQGTDLHRVSPLQHAIISIDYNQSIYVQDTVTTK